MTRCRLFSLVVLAAVGRVAHAQTIADVNFTETYESVGLRGELLGLHLDAHGNATNVDPIEVLLFAVPPNVGITASAAHPYAFVPYTYQQYYENPFTHLIGVHSTTTSGVYGFNVQNGQIVQSPLDLTLIDAQNGVSLFFNAGSFTTEGTATYGITADGESDYYWPTVDASVSYSLVSGGPFTAVPEPGALGLVGAGAAAMLLVGWLRHPLRRARSSTPASRRLPVAPG
ncbi:MAG TPA: hypothetical protein VGD56_16725 [Gemmatirosa sp.]